MAGTKFIQRGKPGIVYRAFFEGNMVRVRFEDESGKTKESFYEKRVYDQNIADGVWILV